MDLAQHALDGPQHQALGVLAEGDHGKTQRKGDEEGAHNVEDGVELGIPEDVEHCCAAQTLGIVLHHEHVWVRGNDAGVAGPRLFPRNSGH